MIYSNNYQTLRTREVGYSPFGKIDSNECTKLDISFFFRVGCKNVANSLLKY